MTFIPLTIHPWVWLAQIELFGLLLSISLSRVLLAIYPLLGEEQYKPFTLKCPPLGKIAFYDLLEGCKLLDHWIICLSFPIPLVLAYWPAPKLCLSCHCILEADNLSDITGSQLERNFASGWIIPGVLLIYDLDDIYMRLWILGFKVDAGMN